MNYKVVVTDHRFPSLALEKEVLGEIGADIVDLTNGRTDEFLPECESADAMLVGLKVIDRDIIARLKKCKVIVRYGIGIDNVDIAAAEEKGIAVCNVPDYAIDEVAEHALTLLLIGARKIIPADRMIREGGWSIINLGAMHRFSAMVVGVIGLGRIGGNLARKCAGLGFKVLGYDPVLTAWPHDEAVAIVTMEELLSRADLISVHVPQMPQTSGLIGTRELSLLKPNCFIVNTSRGGVIKEQSLLEALEGKKIAGAALDVFEEEPLPMSSPLRQLNNVIFTPHMSWLSEEARQNLQRKAAEEVLRGLTGKALKNRVN